MRRIPDKLGNSILIGDKIDGQLEVKLETLSNTLTLGYLNTDTKTFNIEWYSPAVTSLSAKFMSEAKTFDKITFGNESITLNSLLYLLSLPHGIQINSFAELVHISTDFEFVQFKSKFQAMLYMCDKYEEYFNAHSEVIDTSTINLSGHELIVDTKLFIEASLLTIRNLASRKLGGDPYFLQLAKFYNYLKAHETDND